MPKYKVTKYETTKFVTEIDTDVDEFRFAGYDSLEEAADQIDRCDFDYVSVYPDVRYEFEEIKDA